MVTKRYHILIDLEKVESPNMTDGENLKNFLNLTQLLLFLTFNNSISIINKLMFRS